MCPLKTSDLAAARPAQARDQLRPAGEVEPRRHERLAAKRVGVRLPEVDLGTGGAEARGQILLQRGFGARRIADVSRGRVEADQVGCQAHELVAAAADLVADELLAARFNISERLTRCYGVRVSEAAIENSLLDEARSLIDLATSRGVVLRLVGGLAVRVLCPDLPAAQPHRAGSRLLLGRLVAARPAAAARRARVRAPTRRSTRSTATSSSTSRTPRRAWRST